MRTTEVTTFDVQADLQQDKTLKTVRALTSQVKGQAFFDPDSYKNSGYDFSLAKHRLSRDQLKEYAVSISDLRASILDKASNAFRAAPVEG